MHLTAPNLEQRLRGRGLHTDVRELSESTRTAAEAAAAVARAVALIAKFPAAGEELVSMLDPPELADVGVR